MSEAWDGGWSIGYDTTAAYARKALNDAGISREQACGMTLAELRKVPGIGLEEVNRLWAHGIHSDTTGRRWPE